MVKVSSLQEVSAQLETSQAELLVDLENVNRLLRSEGSLKGAWATFQNKILHHLRLVDDIVELSVVQKILEERGNQRILEFLKFNVKDLKVKLLFLMDTYTPQGKFRNFPFEFSGFAADVLAEINIEKTYLSLKDLSR